MGGRSGAGSPAGLGLLLRCWNRQTKQPLMVELGIEPSEEEREQGAKIPTRAHRAVAELAKPVSTLSARMLARVGMAERIKQLVAQAVQGDVVCPAARPAEEWPPAWPGLTSGGKSPE